MQTHSLEQILAEHPFFEGLKPEYVALLVGCASNVVFHAGEYIMSEGDPADHFYIIRQGMVARELAAPGHGAIPIQTEGEGDVLGWSWLIPPHRWRFDGRAVELTRAIALDGACLRGKCDEDHDLGYELLTRFSQEIVERLENARLQLLDMYSANTDS